MVWSQHLKIASPPYCYIHPLCGTKLIVIYRTMNKYLNKIINSMLNKFGVRNKKWRKFSNLADSIELARQRGYGVTWNEEFKGVYFDVTIEINKSPSLYLLIVKCIESKEKVTPQQVKEFIEEAEQVEATIAILVSESGFEKECEKLYKFSLIRLITLETINNQLPEVLTNVFNLVLNQYDFRFLTPNGRFFGFPDEPGILKSSLQDSKIEGVSISTTPEEILNKVKSEIYKTASGKPKEFKYDFPKGTVLIHPNTMQKIPILNFTFDYRLFTAADLEDSAIYKKSPYIIDNIIKDELLKRNDNADLSKIDSGFDTTLQVKKYYYNPKLQFSYYCEKRNKDLAVMVLVESYQANQLLQARFEISNQQSNQFIEITNKEEVKRLAELYEKFSVSDRNLTGRFKAFLKTLDNAECIDDLLLTEEQERAKKADYFFNNREIIAELKSLETDSSQKIQKLVEKYQKRQDFPIFFGRVDLQRLIEELPDRKQINKEVVEAVTDSIEGIIEGANRQIRETKQSFALPDSGGLLIILNDLVFSLPPDVIAYRINRTLNKKTCSGEARFPFISTVLVIHTAHYIPINPQLDAMPILNINNQSSQSVVIENLVEELIPEWSRFEGVPLLNIDEPNILDLKFRETRDKRAKKKNQ